MNPYPSIYEEGDRVTYKYKGLHEFQFSILIIPNLEDLILIIFSYMSIY